MSKWRHGGDHVNRVKLWRLRDHRRRVNNERKAAKRALKDSRRPWLAGDES